MEYCHRRFAAGVTGRYRTLLFFLVALCLVGAGFAHAQDDPEPSRQLEETVRGAVSTRQDTQQQLDGWAAEQVELTRRYRAAEAQVKWLTGRRADEQQRLDALEARIAEMARRLGESQRLEASIQDTMMVLMGRLEDSVDAGLPFLPAERELRLESLRSELLKPDVPSAEKLRRLLEALQVEAGYAATIEVSNEPITVAGQRIHADILRVGRLALFWRTPDGERSGRWDAAAGEWVESDGRDVPAIARAMEMATRRRTPDVIGLPLGRIAP